MTMFGFMGVVMSTKVNILINTAPERERMRTEIPPLEDCNAN